MNRQIRSVMDRYVASNIECCEFESQQGRFFKIFFFHLYIVLLRIYTLIRPRAFFQLFGLSFHIFPSESLSFNIVFFFLSFIKLRQTYAITINFSALHLTNLLQG